MIIMKAAVIFHSVCANTYLMAKKYAKFLEANNIETILRRVEDDDLEDLAATFPTIDEYKDEIKSIEVAVPNDLLNNDLIFLGSPTYFGNVSAEMKCYMDQAADFWPDALLAGKRLGAFTTVGNSEGGGHICLQAINTFGQHMGMVPIPVPSNLVPGTYYPGYGLIHYTGDLADQRPKDSLDIAIKAYVDYFIKF